MAKYDVELATDKHGKPMPQYYDEQEGIMKPITRDNFDGTINGSVDVEFPDVQKVEVTNPSEYPTELNVNVNNPVDTVSVDNLPDVQRVEITNTQKEMDVNVLNPVNSVNVDNLPTDYPDQAVEARLQAIEQTQSQILDKLNDTIDTRLTGSKVGLLKEHDVTVSQGIRYNFFGSNYSTGVSGLRRLDISNYNEVFFWVENNTFTSLNVRLYMGDTGATGGSTAGREYFVRDVKGDILKIPSRTNAWFSSKQYPDDEAINILRESPFTHFGIRLLLDEVPTDEDEWNLVLKIYGRK